MSDADDVRPGAHPPDVLTNGLRRRSGSFDDAGPVDEFGHITTVAIVGSDQSIECPKTGHDCTMRVETAWVDGVVTLGGDASIAAASALDLAARYNETHRHYHRATHVEAVLTDAARLAAAESLSLHERAVLNLAICAHDVVYNAQPGDDERASAEWARRHLAAAGIDDEATDTVAALVLTTLTHSFDPDDTLAAVLSDADLAILGADPPAYDAYSSAVREEFRAVTDDLWAVGRRQVLEHLLAKPRLFVTQLGFDEWEVRARDNVRRELDSLPVRGA